MVRVRNYHGRKEKWVLGTIVKKLGPRTFQVLVQGELRMCHLDQLIASAEKPYEEIEDDLGVVVSNIRRQPEGERRFDGH